jgi:hypothetical protein
MQKSHNSSSKVTLKIPRPLYDKISRVIEGSGYNSVTDFVVYVLRDLVASHKVPGAAGFSNDDIELVKQRLAGLGYLDSTGLSPTRNQDSDKEDKNG